ncbi:XopAH/AvrB family type III secretion system effector (plasmid) [Xanthomonas axonopodis pv. cyamopsidis]|uniref:XopAH/AvrB family type III secretion system effector n=1 Tax=Xanthomonas axonopodis TaxID=53413 RepID=UPI003556BD41
MGLCTSKPSVVGSPVAGSPEHYLTHTAEQATPSESSSPSRRDSHSSSPSALREALPSPPRRAASPEPQGSSSWQGAGWSGHEGFSGWSEYQGSLHDLAHQWQGVSIDEYPGAPADMWSQPAWNPYASFDTGTASSHSQAVQGAATNYLPGPATYPKLSLEEQSLVGAARWPDDAPGLNISNKSNTQDNKRYCKSLYEASRRAGGSIASGQINSFNDLWQKATQWRLSRIPSGDPSKGDFAAERMPNTKFVTSLRRPYHSVIERVRNHPDAEKELYEGEYFKAIEVKVYRQYGVISGEIIPMTKVSAAVDDNAISARLRNIPKDKRQQARESMAASHPNMITHTGSECIKTIKDHLESLYLQAIDPSLEKHEVFELIARVHWWAASGAPDKRGSAAKAEFAARSIASAHGIEMPPFRHGIVPDIEAMLRSENQFVADYPNFFERPPI